MRLNSRTIFSAALLTLLMTCLAAARASAQDITGTIVGLVRDAGGAAIAGATVTIRDNDKNVVARVVTTDGEALTRPRCFWPGATTSRSRPRASRNSSEATLN